MLLLLLNSSLENSNIREHIFINAISGGNTAQRRTLQGCKYLLHKTEERMKFQLRVAN